MPGGMYGPNQTANVRALVARLPAPQGREPNPEPPAGPGPGPAELPTPRHCWRVVPGHDPVPGLRLCWERHGNTWWGLFATTEIRAGAVITTSEWAPADQLHPAWPSR